MTPDPTPQPAHDHGAAGFCTDYAQAADERVETAARIVEFYATSKPPKALLVADPARAWREHYLAASRQILAVAVVAALDGETARLRAEVDHAWRHVGEAEGERDTARAALDRVRALAEDADHHWAIPAGWAVPDGGSGDTATVIRLADLRAALDPEEPR